MHFYWWSTLGDRDARLHNELVVKPTSDFTVDSVCDAFTLALSESRWNSGSERRDAEKPIYKILARLTALLSGAAYDTSVKRLEVCGAKHEDGEASVSAAVVGV